MVEWQRMVQADHGEVQGHGGGEGSKGGFSHISLIYIYSAQSHPTHNQIQLNRLYELLNLSKLQVMWLHTCATYTTLGGTWSKLVGPSQPKSCDIQIFSHTVYIICSTSAAYVIWWTCTTQRSCDSRLVQFAQLWVAEPSHCHKATFTTEPHTPSYPASPRLIIHPHSIYTILC